MVEYLKRQDKPSLAFEYIQGDDALPAVVFLGGFRSDMMGSKAAFLKEQCVARGQSYLRFDYSGHGKSEGDFEQLCLSDWAQDARDILTHTSPHKPILVGSSMGGWISLIVAQEDSFDLSAFIGIAAAPDFTTWMEEGMSADQKSEMKEKGFILLPSDYDQPYVITRKLIEDGRDNKVMETPIELGIPVRLLQGKQDKDVPWEVAEKIKANIKSKNVEIYYSEEGNHSLSNPEDLAMLDKTIIALISA